MLARPLVLGLAAALLWAPVASARSPLFEPGPPPSFDAAPLPPPPPPPPAQSGEALEPEITITPGRAGTITEYRLNGVLYMIRVTPAAPGFPPYYLVDADGDGLLETRRSGLQRGFLIPAWVIHRW